MTAGILLLEAPRRRRAHSTVFANISRSVALTNLAAKPGAGLLSWRNILLVVLVAVLHTLVVWRPWANAPEVLPASPRAVEIELARPLPVAAPVSPPQPLPVRAPQTPAPLHSVPKTPATEAAPVLRESERIESAAPDSNASSKSESAALPPVAHNENSVPVETPALGRLGYQNNPPPAYPDSALDRGLEGTVLLKVRVLANGRAESVEIQQTSGWRILDDAAIHTVRYWLFVPASRGGIALDGWATVPIVFKLRK